MTTLRCAISPDADDLFMFRALLEGLVPTEGLDFEVVARDTDLLNRVASGGQEAGGAAFAALPEVSAISVAHYPKVAHRYRLLGHGASVGRGYGPVLVARPDRAPAVSAALEGRGPPVTIAVPGLTTTACGVLARIAREGGITGGREGGSTGARAAWLDRARALGEQLAGGADPWAAARAAGARLEVPSRSARFTPEVLPITPPARTWAALREGLVDAALVIHEGRLTYADEGFVLLLDIGVRWAEETGLPLPLGGNVLSRALPPEDHARADRVLQASVRHALADREAAITWLGGPRARALAAAAGSPEPTLTDRARLDTYLRLYANEDTADMGAEGWWGVGGVLAELG